MNELRELTWRGAVRFTIAYLCGAVAALLAWLVHWQKPTITVGEALTAYGVAIAMTAAFGLFVWWIVRERNAEIAEDEKAALVAEIDRMRQAAGRAGMSFDVSGSVLRPNRSELPE